MIKIGTRGSPLAVRQADGAAHKLVQPYELEIIKSQGDIDQKTPIYEMGGKHVFCSALEESFYPSPEKIAKVSYEMVTKKKNWKPRKIKTKEIEEFKGPF